ncbi:MAG: Flp pilus assembly complex ATPase component TadA [Elusimicrobia bacterium]|nr:Flp pilus assembly complex ATPase component TadA [Elusimicrobiota bacterium]
MENEGRMSLTLADALVAGGVLSEEQREKALRLARQSKGQFADAVVKLGFCREEDIAVAVAKQQNIPYASRENKILKAEKGQGLEKVIPESYARQNCLLPLFQDEGVLAVAISDPDNVLLLDNLKLLTGLEIQPFIATKTQIIKTIDEFYLGGNVIDRTLGAKPAEEEAAAEETGGEERLNLDQVAAYAHGAQAITLVNAILKQAIQERSSDIHIEKFDERVVLRFRIDGVLYERTPPPRAMFNAIVSRLKILSRLDIAERRLPQDGQFSIKVQNRVIDLRVSICPCVFGEKVVLRLLDKGAVELDINKIGLEARQRDDMLEAARRPHGLFFMTGPTGSGKTTTLGAILHAIRSPEINIMTIEDPVELKIEGINQVQVRSNIGLTFASALRSFLRQDPDVILVGEVRDQETAQTCLRAALTGHLVISTLHTNDALSCVVRLIDMGIEPFLLANSLQLAAAQRLVRLLCPHCRKPAKVPPELAAQVVRDALLEQPPDPASVVFYEPRGCEKCARTGYVGRKAIYEVYKIDAAMREIIYRHGGDLARLRQAAESSGMWSMRASGFRKAVAGLTTIDEVMSVTVLD